MSTVNTRTNITTPVTTKKPLQKAFTVKLDIDIYERLIGDLQNTDTLINDILKLHYSLGTPFDVPFQSDDQNSKVLKPQDISSWMEWRRNIEQRLGELEKPPRKRDKSLQHSLNKPSLFTATKSGATVKGMQTAEIDSIEF